MAKMTGNAKKRIMHTFSHRYQVPRLMEEHKVTDTPKQKERYYNQSNTPLENRIQRTIDAQQIDPSTQSQRRPQERITQYDQEDHQQEIRILSAGATAQRRYRAH